ncbi:hypothetical protein L226DRAFT_2355 [Lentinus tigrinus ALCF2SS1-7]|uniref:uncharacterized protein n=1 Tax=Lentinus tigrinus ALCF2SS1-7 TaxID=1328758 RepID=UPI0011660EB7|nr:hypothetical protein L226DRAFT_2355 [Lentinus tigrinus ALCF2SS1-7]
MLRTHEAIPTFFSLRTLCCRRIALALSLSRELYSVLCRSLPKLARGVELRDHVTCGCLYSAGVLSLAPAIRLRTRPPPSPDHTYRIIFYCCGQAYTQTHAVIFDSGLSRIVSTAMADTRNLPLVGLSPIWQGMYPAS